jgi:hypothetical protein
MLSIENILKNQFFIMTLYFIYSIIPYRNKCDVLNITDVSINKLQKHLRKKNKIFMLTVKDEIVIMNIIKINKYMQFLNMNLFALEIYDNLLIYLINNNRIELHKKFNASFKRSIISFDTEIPLKNFTINIRKNPHFITQLCDSQNKILTFIKNKMYSSNYEITTGKFNDIIFMYGEYKNNKYIIKYIYDSLPILEDKIKCDNFYNKLVLYSISLLLNITAPFISTLVNTTTLYLLR